MKSGVESRSLLPVQALVVGPVGRGVRHTGRALRGGPAVAAVLLDPIARVSRLIPSWSAVWEKGRSGDSRHSRTTRSFSSGGYFRIVMRTLSPSGSFQSPGTERADLEAEAITGFLAAMHTVDLVLANAVTAGVIAPDEAALIGATRFDGEYLTTIARRTGSAPTAVSLQRRRAEQRLYSQLTSSG